MRRIVIPSLLLSLTLTAAAAEKPVNDAVPTSARPISTGVTAPQLVYSTKISIPASQLPAAFPGTATVVLKFTLDKTGSPQAIQIVHPLTQPIDARVVEAVRQFRWTPAVLNNQTVPIEMNLTVQVQR